MERTFRFIDLFAGIGGMRLAFERNGYECVFSSEWDKHAREMYELNHNEVPAGDITQISAADIPDHEVLLAGFPCQPFSISGKKEGFADTRGTLFFDVLRIAEEKKPEVLVLENVKHLIHHDNGRTLQVIIRSLMQLGYKVSWKLLNGKDFGLPQNRERIIIVASKIIEFEFDLLSYKEPVILEDFLETDAEFEFLDPTEYTLIPEGYVKKQASGLIFVGYRNKKIRVAGVREGTEHLSRVHKQPNRIYSAKGTHPTLPSQETSGRYFIYHNNRVRKLTLKECYSIMGFPSDFKLTEPIGECYKRVGNSVCVPMIEEIARQVKLQILSREDKKVVKTHYDILEEAYQFAQQNSLEDLNLNPEDIELLTGIVEQSEKRKGVYSVLVTSLAHKILNPHQDIRLHQSNMEGGYSGRTVDTKYVTPFLKSVGFPAMKESGWLTRSLEQNSPYDKDFPGKITPVILKEFFLEILDKVETFSEDPLAYLQALFILSLQEQGTREVTIINPIEKESNIPIRTIMSYLIEHFNTNNYSKVAGASRLPVIALYSVYQCMIDELKRFNGKSLRPLGSHNSADMRSGAVGDIEIEDTATGEIYEAVEVKHGIFIDSIMINDAFAKFSNTSIQRYYILSSVGIEGSEKDAVSSLVDKIEDEHGCQVIPNGLIHTLNYYLRLIEDTDKFLEYYVENLSKDETIKKEHKNYWNKMFE
ncbi:DNA (cytosine-5-)-methyltransferase [Lysinibacillus capsici]|uniref:DNA (cytosine-5-)-methyltransferase n=1 Tax=Lysinibacillus capsici TaxID=2115968 RepID=UPI002E1B4577|nr:DNA (cytosine-5-)-methyltransferase [Lysinibacillus capsici]